MASVTYVMCAEIDTNSSTAVEEEVKEELAIEKKNEKRERVVEMIGRQVEVRREQLASSPHPSLPPGLCSSGLEIAFIVLITTCLNWGVFLFICFCRGSVILILLRISLLDESDPQKTNISFLSGFVWRAS